MPASAQAAGDQVGGRAPAATAPSFEFPPPPEAVRPTKNQPDLHCTLIGPGKAGKTNLIDACEQACADPATCGLPVEIEYIGGAKTREQAERSARSVADGYRLPPTPDVQAYDAFLSATWPATFWRPEKRVSLRLHFLDGPGGALFPAKADEGNPALQVWERRLIAESREADAIILCIDSTDPQLDRVAQYLRTLLAAVALPYDMAPQSLPLGHRLLRALRRTSDPQPVTLRRIRARRFLLLLTKIDRLVNGPQDRAPRWSGRGPTPLAIAANLSPLALACELVHASNLLRILAALRPGAELAVGLTSAWGFGPSGYPFMESNVPVRLSNQPADNRTSDWRPFGLREVFQFLLYGGTGGPVERVTRERVARYRRHVLDLPSWYFA